MTYLIRFAALTLALTVSGVQNSGDLEPFPPFKIAGNLYYVGSHGKALVLVYRHMPWLFQFLTARLGTPKRRGFPQPTE